MSRLARQVAIVATVFALSGPHALVSACLALCFGGTPAVHHAASNDAPLAASVPQHHEHHQVPAASSGSEGVAAGHDAPAVRLTVLDDRCCADGAITPVVMPRSVRADDQALAIAQAPSSLRHTAAIDRPVPSSSPPVSPPLPIGAPIPLRV